MIFATANLVPAHKPRSQSLMHCRNPPTCTQSKIAVLDAHLPAHKPRLPSWMHTYLHTDRDCRPGCTPTCTRPRLQSLMHTSGWLSSPLNIIAPQFVRRPKSRFRMACWGKYHHGPYSHILYGILYGHIRRTSRREDATMHLVWRWTHPPQFVRRPMACWGEYGHNIRRTSRREDATMLWTHPQFVSRRPKSWARMACWGEYGHIRRTSRREDATMHLVWRWTHPPQFVRRPKSRFRMACWD